MGSLYSRLAKQRFSLLVTAETTTPLKVITVAVNKITAFDLPIRLFIHQELKN
jgi:hypothetical protein